MNKKILIVDDSSSNIDFIYHILKDRYNIYVATDGISSFKILEKTEPDLILLDWILPDMRGDSFLKTIKRNPSADSIPVIVISGIQDKETIQNIKKSSIFAFLPKPFKKSDLEKEVQAALTTKENPMYSFHNLLQDGYDLLYSAILSLKSCNRAEKHNRIPLLALILSIKLKLSQQDCLQLYLSFPLRDIGILFIPSQLFSKKEALSFEEWEWVKGHCIKGSKFLSTRQSSLSKTAADLALGHHEHWNGNGYPQRLAKEDIPINCRITAILDTLESLTSFRPYRKPLLLEEALRIISSQAGEQFDPYLIMKLQNISQEVNEVFQTTRLESIEHRYLNKLR